MRAFFADQGLRGERDCLQCRVAGSQDWKQPTHDLGLLLQVSAVSPPSLQLSPRPDDERSGAGVVLGKSPEELFAGVEDGGEKDGAQTLDVQRRRALDL